MIVIALYILIFGGALCFGLSRLLPTRVLGAMAALLCLGAAVPALAAAPAGADGALTPLVIGDAPFTLLPWLPLAQRGVAAALLAGAGAALLALAGAVAGGVRGFGALFGWALVAVAATLLSLAAPPFSLMHPLAWAVIAIAGYGALRASGAEGSAETPPPGLTFGLLASAVLTVALAGGAAAPGGPAPSLASGIVAALALAGCPPLLLAREEAVGGPAPLGALIFGVCGPGAALGWLLAATATVEARPALPPGWGAALALAGALGALACGAGALGERRLRPLLAWVAGAQASLVVAAAGLAGPLAALAGPALLTSAMLAAALCGAAAVSFERATGSDDYTAPGPAPRLAAAAWAAGALASLGLPPLWGFWGRLWLLEAAVAQQPWLAAPLLAGLALLALALLAPLAGLWAAAGRAAPGRGSWADWAPAALALLPLLALGAAPGLAWGPWLRALPAAPGADPAGPAGRGVMAAAGLLIVVLAAALARSAPARTLARDPDEDAVRLGPDALGETLRPLAWLAGPRPLIGGAYALLERASAGLRLLMGVFEQRYYLLGMLAALITIMLLMAQ